MIFSIKFFIHKQLINCTALQLFIYYNMENVCSRKKGKQKDVLQKLFLYKILCELSKITLNILIVKLTTMKSVKLGNL